MKKLSLISLLILLVFTACEDIPNDVIDSTDPDYRLLAINVPSEFFYSPSDSVFTTSAKFENTSTIARVWFNIVTDDGTASIKQNVQMLDDGSSESGDSSANDGTYTGNTILGESIASRNYVIEYYVENNARIGDDKTQLVASHTFLFTSNSENFPPQISNLIMPDSIKLDELFEFSIEAYDPNGLVDINRVYYELYRPDGSLVENSQGISKFPLSDNGDTNETGDLIAGDAIFTMRLMIPNGQQVGEWRFEFTAEDNFGALSNTIIHTLTVQ